MALTVKFFSFLSLADCRVRSSDSQLSGKKEKAQMTGSLSFFLFSGQQRKTPRLFWSDSQKKKAKKTLTVEFFPPRSAEERATALLAATPLEANQEEGLFYSLSLLAAESGKVK